METIKQEDFLQEYFKDKENWALDKKEFDVYKDFLRQKASSDNLDIMVNMTGRNILRCQIYLGQIGFNQIGLFDLPEAYEDFKTIMDILLKDN
jgi:hypothetical protein